MLCQLIYQSKAATSFDKVLLDELLEQSRRDNAAEEITGFLMFDGTGFVQLLEGERTAINDLFKKRIAVDPRHTDVDLLIQDRTSARVFTDWAMAYLDISEGGLPRFGGNITFDATKALVAQLKDSADPLTNLTAEFLEDLVQG